MQDVSSASDREFSLIVPAKAFACSHQLTLVFIEVEALVAIEADVYSGNGPTCGYACSWLLAAVAISTVVELGVNPSNIAIAKFTHSGSQINDWTPQGTNAKDRNLYPQFIAFVKESIQDLNARGHEVELAGIFYHVGENDMSYGPYRKNASQWLQSIVQQSRLDLAIPSLKWFVSQQPPTDDKALNAIDVTANLAAIASAEAAIIHLKAFDLSPQKEKLVMATAGIVQLGEWLAQRYLELP